MDVTIIGTGLMARGIGSRVLAGGHDLTVVGKDAQRAEDAAGELAGGGNVRSAAAGDPLNGDVVVLAVYYPDARGAVEQYRDQLAGKVVVDITNPVDTQTWDKLATPPGTSSAEEVQ
jgi:predicted dinucleotide-binding enzyme